jgi:membrane-associated phospholipid phosphatase
MIMVTHFGATVLLAPFAILVACWLLYAAGLREAFLWCCCVAGVGVVTAIAKIYFAACDLHLLDIHSPSGHTAFSGIAYGGFTVIAMAGSHSLRANLFRIGTALWVMLIGFSRVVVQAHTPGEVIVGLIIGGVSVAVFAALYRGRVRPPYALAGGILLVIALVALSMPNQVFTLEGWLHQVARMLLPYKALICMAP